MLIKTIEFLLYSIPQLLKIIEGFFYFWLGVLLFYSKKLL